MSNEEGQKARDGLWTGLCRAVLRTLNFILRLMESPLKGFRAGSDAGHPDTDSWGPTVPYSVQVHVALECRPILSLSHSKPFFWKCFP